MASEQLAFFKDEIIVVTASSDPHWWVSGTTSPQFFCTSQEGRNVKEESFQNLFPSTFVLFIFPQVGHIEGDLSRSGTFPANYVHRLTD